jgi:adenosylcobinamide-GDP ribazoletransferase
MKMSLVGVVIGLVIALVLMGPMALWALIVGLVVTAIMRQLAKVKIGGQTGDVLGATQIISETMMLVAVVSITPTL